MDALRFDAGAVIGQARFDEQTGFLHVDARVTRTGVLTYKLPDGTIRKELRHPDDVFRADSLATLKLVPTTNGHPYTEPRGLITAENAKKWQAGHVGESVAHDERWVTAPIVVTDGATIDAIKRGRRQLSCGYIPTLVREDGEYQGERYTHRQTNIRYNHVAHVDSARVGAEAEIRLDAADGIEIDPSEDSPMSNLVNVNLDGIVYQAAPEVERALAKARMDAAHANEKATADLDAAKGREDALQAKLDAAGARVAELEKRDVPGEIKAGVKARTALEATARRVLPGDTNLDEMDDAAIRKAVILAVQKDANLDGKSESYIEARFDAVVEGLPAPKNEQPAPKPAPTNHDASDGMTREQMVAAMRDAWKQPANAA